MTPKPEVKPDVAKASVPRVEGQIRKAFETHPQLVAKLEGAPDKDKADAYRKFLTQKGITGAYLVTVEVTEASEEVEPMDKPNSQRLIVGISIHVLGETIPGRTIGFTGDGRAKIKQEIGKKLRPRDREVAWDQAAEIASADAMQTVFKQLEKPAEEVAAQARGDGRRRASGPGAAVAVLEPHHVVELGRRDLEHVGVLDRDHPVAQPRLDVERLARGELARARLLPSAKYTSCSRPESTMIVSSLTRWYCSESDSPARTCRILPT